MPAAPLHFISRRDQLLPWLYFFALGFASVLATAISFAPLPLNGILPNFWLAIMFVWVLWRPELASYSIFFVLGLLQDLVLALPLGLHAVLGVTSLYALARLRPFIFARPFFWLLAAFATFQLIYAVLLAVLAWPFGLGAWDSIMLPRWLMGVGCFILLYRPLFIGLRLIVNLADAR